MKKLIIMMALLSLSMMRGMCSGKSFKTPSIAEQRVDRAIENFDYGICGQERWKALILLPLYETAKEIVALCWGAYFNNPLLNTDALTNALKGVVIKAVKETYGEAVTIQAGPLCDGIGSSLAQQVTEEMYAFARVAKRRIGTKDGIIEKPVTSDEIISVFNDVIEKVKAIKATNEKDFIAKLGHIQLNPLNPYNHDFFGAIVYGKNY